MSICHHQQVIRGGIMIVTIVTDILIMEMPEASHIILQYLFLF